MTYLSHLLGKRVLDSVGQPLGNIADLAITLDESFGDDFPRVTLVLVRARRSTPALALGTDFGFERGRGAAARLCSIRRALTSPSARKRKTNSFCGAMFWTSKSLT